MKPIATLRKALASVDVRNEGAFVAAFERSDVCAVAAASVVGEAMVAIVLCDAVLEKFGGDSLRELSRNVRPTANSSRGTSDAIDRPKWLHGDRQEHGRAAARRSPRDAIRQHRRGDGARDGRSVPELWREEGEAAFRRREADLVERLFADACRA